MTGDEFYSISQSVENYTPRSLWTRAIQVMGAIDTDPASDENLTIPATTHFTKEIDGLQQPWVGRVWLNPPFGEGIEDWFRKLGKEIAEKRVTEAIVLWKAAMETRAMRILVSIPEYRCSAVPRKRISYHSGERKQGNSSTFTTMLHYFGKNEENFQTIFGEIADIWICVKHKNTHQKRLL